MNNNLLVVKQLIAIGADINATSKDGQTALMLAVTDNCYECFVELTRQAVDVNVQAKDGTTALQKAVYFADHLQLRMFVQPLIQLGADPNLRALNGESALTHAVWRDDNQCITDLLAVNASVNVQDHLGVTPFIIAVLHNNYDMALTFLRMECVRSKPIADGSSWSDKRALMTVAAHNIDRKFNKRTSRAFTELLLGAGEDIPLRAVKNPHDVLIHAYTDACSTLEGCARHSIRKHLKVRSSVNLISQTKWLPVPDRIKAFLCFLSEPFAYEN